MLKSNGKFQLGFQCLFTFGTIHYYRTWFFLTSGIQTFVKSLASGLRLLKLTVQGSRRSCLPKYELARGIICTTSQIQNGRWYINWCDGYVQVELIVCRYTHLGPTATQKWTGFWPCTASCSLSACAETTSHLPRKRLPGIFKSH